MILIIFGYKSFIYRILTLAEWKSIYTYIYHLLHIIIMATEKTKIKIIRPDQIIARDLSLRESADRLFEVLDSSKENKIIIDFSKIEFLKLQQY